MSEDERAEADLAARRQRNLLVGGIGAAVIAVVSLVAMVLGVHLAAGFAGGFGGLAVVLLWSLRGERRAARRAGPERR